MGEFPVCDFEHRSETYVMGKIANSVFSDPNTWAMSEISSNLDFEPSHPHIIGFREDSLLEVKSSTVRIPSDVAICSHVFGCVRVDVPGDWCESCKDSGRFVCDMFNRD